MGIFYEEKWECKSCGYQFFANDGLYEADPNDFGTTHSVKPYYCSKCGNVENLSFCISLEPPEDGNEELCIYDDTKCKKCNTEMKIMKKTTFFHIKKKYICPKCGKKALVFTNERNEIWT